MPKGSRFLQLILLVLVLTFTSQAMAYFNESRALQFDGENNYTTIPGNDSFDFANGVFSVSARFATTASPELANYILRRNTVGFRGYSLYLDNSGEVFAKLFEVQSGGGQIIIVNINTDIAYNDGDWHSAAMTYDGDTFKLYVDGILKATESVTVDMSNIESDLYIGSGGDLDGGWSGYLDDIRLYNRALSAEEIQKLYCRECDVDPDGLVAHWDFEESSGQQQVKDNSGNGNYGYLGSSPDADASDPIRILYEYSSYNYYVDDNGDGDPTHGIPDPNRGGTKSDPVEDGSSLHPFDSIQKAINEAIENSKEYNGICRPQIIVSDGIYSDVGNYDIDPNGLACTIRSENGFEDCIIDCNDLGRGFVLQNYEEPNTIIDGFTITEGNSPDYGGGIDCNEASPTIQNCKLTFNYAADSGGAIFLGPYSDARISNCQILLNESYEAGGGIYSLESTPEIKNCIIAGNIGYWSGGISSSNYSNSTIINCTIADNFAVYENGGSGLEGFDNSHTKIMDSIIWGNYDIQVTLDEGATIDVNYCDIQIVDPNGRWDPNANWLGEGNINVYPLFVSSRHFDYHLKSEYGRWIPYAYTNGDFNNDGFVDYIDYSIMVRFWQEEGFEWLLYGDPMYNIVDYNYIEALAESWLQPGINTKGKEFITDGQTSPCIDAGNPDSDYSAETEPNGDRVNMGAYGNTSQASKSSPDTDDP